MQLGSKPFETPPSPPTLLGGGDIRCEEGAVLLQFPKQVLRALMLLAIDEFLNLITVTGRGLRKCER
jgi:hypothetical protein